MKAGDLLRPLLECEYARHAPDYRLAVAECMAALEVAEVPGQGQAAPPAPKPGPYVLADRAVAQWEAVYGKLSLERRGDLVAGIQKTFGGVL